MIPLVLAFAVAVQAPDNARAARWERTLNLAIDSLDRVSGVAAGFRADLEQSSRDLVVVRAAQVHAACDGARAPLEAVEQLLASEVYRSFAQRAQARLRSGTAELRGLLARCEREWDVSAHSSAGAVDSVRAWGPYRSSRLDSAVQRYLGQVRGFMKQVELVKKPTTG